MPEDAIDVEIVPGLHTHTGVRGKGYVVFCHSRACNLAFYKWYVENILIPHVNDIRQEFGYTNENHCWYQLDGEDMQIQCFNHPDILGLLRGANITVGKPPGSTTEITQPCDAGYIFESAKAHNKTLNDSDVGDQADMIARLNNMINTHRSKYVGSDGKRMNDQHKKMCVHGLLRVQLSFTETMTKKTIEHSFKVCGIYPFSLDQILANITTPVSDDLQLKIVELLPRLIREMNVRGQIADKSYSSLNLETLFPENVSDNHNKDDLIVSRRRSCLLTHNAFVESIAVAQVVRHDVVEDDRFLTADLV